MRLAACVLSVAAVAVLEGGAPQQTFRPRESREVTITPSPSGSSLLIGQHYEVENDKFKEVMLVGLAEGVEYKGPTGRMAGAVSWRRDGVRVSGPGVDALFAVVNGGSPESGVYPAGSLVWYPVLWNMKAATEEFLTGMFAPTRPSADVPCRAPAAHAKALGALGGQQPGEPRACQAHCAGGLAACAAQVERGQESRMYCYCTPGTRSEAETGRGRGPAPTVWETPCGGSRLEEGM